MASGNSDVTLDFIRSVLAKESTDSILTSDPIPEADAEDEMDRRCRTAPPPPSDTGEQNRPTNDSEHENASHQMKRSVKVKQVKKKRSKKPLPAPRSKVTVSSSGHGSSQSADISDNSDRYSDDFNDGDDDNDFKYRGNKSKRNMSAKYKTISSMYTVHIHEHHHSNNSRKPYMSSTMQKERTTSRPRKRSPKIRRGYFQPRTSEDMLQEKYSELQELLNENSKYSRYKLQVLPPQREPQSEHRDRPVYMKTHFVPDMTPRSDCGVQTDEIIDDIKGNNKSVEECQNDHEILIDATDADQDKELLSSERYAGSDRKRVSFGGHEMQVKAPIAVRVPRLENIESDSSPDRVHCHDNDAKITMKKESVSRQYDEYDEEAKSLSRSRRAHFNNRNASAKSLSPKNREISLSPKSSSNRSEAKSEKSAIRNRYFSESDSDSSPSPSRHEKRSDHQLKNVDNPTIKAWLRQKNKMLRQQKRDERKKEREKMKEAVLVENEKVEKMVKSEKRVRQWMRKKQKEARLLRRKQRSQLRLTNESVSQAENSEEQMGEDVKRAPVIGQEKTTSHQKSTNQAVENVSNAEARLIEEESKQTMEAADMKTGKKSSPSKSEYVYIRPTTRKAVLVPRISKQNKSPERSNSAKNLKSSPETSAEEKRKTSQKLYGDFVKKTAEDKVKPNNKGNLSFDEWMKKKRIEEVEKKKAAKKKEEEAIRQSDPEMGPIVSKMARHRMDVMRGRKVKIDTGVDSVDEEANAYPKSKGAEVSSSQDGETSESDTTRQQYSWRSPLLDNDNNNNNNNNKRNKDKPTKSSNRPMSSRSARGSQYKPIAPPKSSQSPNLPAPNMADKGEEDSGKSPFVIIPAPPMEKLTTSGSRGSARRQKYAKFVEQKLSEERPEPQGCDQPSDSKANSDSSSLASVDVTEKVTGVPPLSPAVTAQVYSVKGPSVQSGSRSPKSVVFAEDMNEEITLDNNDEEGQEEDCDKDKFKENPEKSNDTQYDKGENLGEENRKSEKVGEEPAKQDINEANSDAIVTIEDDSYNGVTATNMSSEATCDETVTTEDYTMKDFKEGNEENDHSAEKESHDAMPGEAHGKEADEQQDMRDIATDEVGKLIEALSCDAMQSMRQSHDGQEISGAEDAGIEKNEDASAETNENTDINSKVTEDLANSSSSRDESQAKQADSGFSVDTVTDEACTQVDGASSPDQKSEGNGFDEPRQSKEKERNPLSESFNDSDIEDNAPDYTDTEEESDSDGNDDLLTPGSVNNVDRFDDSQKNESVDVNPETNEKLPGVFLTNGNQ